jgi:hypothetical protein
VFYSRNVGNKSLAASQAVSLVGVDHQRHIPIPIGLEGLAQPLVLLKIERICFSHLSFFLYLFF